MKRALLVEHQSRLRESLCAALDAAGYQIDLAADLAQARSLLDADDYDVVIANDRLPDGRGYDIAAMAAEETGIKAYLVSGGLDEIAVAPVGQPQLRKHFSVRELTGVFAQLAEGG